MTESVDQSLKALRTALDEMPDSMPLTTSRDRSADAPVNGAPVNGAPGAAIPGDTDVPPSEWARLREQATELGPWVQGPFVLGEGLVLGPEARDEERWTELDKHVPTDLTGRRVLIVGCGSGYDAFVFAKRGAGYVLACEPSESVEQAEFLESVYRSGVDLQRRGWASLDPELDGTFDIVHCNGLLHRELEPMALLLALRRLTARGGTLLIGSMMLADPERSELLRFVPNRHAGDPTWWFVPGRLAFRWMVETAGFEVEAEFGEREGPRDAFPVANAYLRAGACGTRGDVPTRATRA